MQATTQDTENEACQCDPPGSGEEFCTGHCFGPQLAVYSDGDAWVVATSPEDALLRWALAHGDTTDGYDPRDWKRCPDLEKLTLDPRDGGPPRTQIMAGWVAEHGPGFLGSTSYL